MGDYCFLFVVVIMKWNADQDETFSTDQHMEKLLQAENYTSVFFRFMLKFIDWDQMHDLSVSNCC